MALRQRLAALNPARMVTVGGTQRPAVVVVENELPQATELQTECFYLDWGTCKVIDASAEPALYGMDCAITYRSRGSVESGVDRGRVLGELDRELLMICQPLFTGKKDFSAAPAEDLGTGVLWTCPLIEVGKQSAGQVHAEPGLVEHAARVTVFFYPEVEL